MCNPTKPNTAVRSKLEDGEPKPPFMYRHPNGTESGVFFFVFLGFFSSSPADPHERRGHVRRKMRRWTWTLENGHGVSPRTEAVRPKNKKKSCDASFFLFNGGVEWI